MAKEEKKKVSNTKKTSTAKKSEKKQVSKETEIVQEIDKNIIEKESYMLYFTLSYIVIRLLFNGLNLIPIVTNFDESTSCVLISFLMIIGTVCAMALNFMVHKKHRINKHQFNYIKKFMLTMFAIVTFLTNVLWIIECIKINLLITLLLLIIHGLVIYLYTLILFNEYVEK